MKKACFAALALALLAPRPARSEEPRRFVLYLRSGASIHLAPSRTMGGLGGGVGVRRVLSGPWITQADFSYLTLIGHVGELRVGAGYQRQGTWTPAVLGTLSVLVGDRFSFRTVEHPWPVPGPTVTGGVTVAPLRFAHAGRTISVLELGVGARPDSPGLGLTYSVGLLEIGVAF